MKATPKGAIKIEGDVITVAMTNPLDIHTLDDVRLLLKKEIKTVLASRADILDAIKNTTVSAPRR